MKWNNIVAGTNLLSVASSLVIGIIIGLSKRNIFGTAFGYISLFVILFSIIIGIYLIWSGLEK